jgi:hypothetical protein
MSAPTHTGAKTIDRRVKVTDLWLSSRTQSRLLRMGVRDLLSVFAGRARFWLRLSRAVSHLLWAGGRALARGGTAGAPPLAIFRGVGVSIREWRRFEDVKLPGHYGDLTSFPQITPEAVSADCPPWAGH